ncbi:MAG: potassium channel family protein, partial [Bacteroidota bacterium]
PGSFQGILLEVGASPEMLTGQLMYFSFITLLTIGYGDIAPITELAQKAAILIGLMGQFYLVIIMAVVVGKFVNQRHGR